MIKKLISPVDRFNVALIGNLLPAGIAWARVGTFVLVISALMIMDYGSQITWKHGLALAGLTFCAAFGPSVSYKAYEDKKLASALVLGTVAGFMLIAEYGSHHAYTSGARGHNIVDARVQNAKYKGAQETVTEDKTDLKMWEKRLADLESEHGWVTTVTAEALRARLASANLAIDLEARRGGCKSRCLERTRERDEIASRVALAEEKADLTKKIEATKRVLASARDKADNTEYKSSAVVYANNALADAVSFVFAGGQLVPSEEIAKGTEISINFIIALVLTVVPAFAYFNAGLYRAPSEPDHGNVRIGGGKPSLNLDNWHKAYARSCSKIGVEPLPVGA